MQHRFSAAFFLQQQKGADFSSAPNFPYNLITLIRDNLQRIPPSLSSATNAKSIQERIDVVHGGHTVATPQSFKLTIANPCYDGIITSQFDVSIVLLDYLCLAVKGLSVVGGCQLKSFHDVHFLSCVFVSVSLLTVCIIAQKSFVVK